MPWTALYDTDTGRLVSVGQIVSDPLPAGLTAVTLPDRPQDSEMWDAPSRAFVARPAKVLVDRLAELLTDPRYADFQDVWANIPAARRTALRNAMIRLLGRHRFRNAAEDTGLD